MPDDGVAALQAVYETGGTTVIPHPGDEFPSMPTQAILQDHPAHVLPLNEIAVKLFELVSSGT